MDLTTESKRSLERILQEVDLNGLSKTDQRLFKSRLSQYFPVLFSHLYEVYGHHYDFFYYLQRLVKVLLSGLHQRSARLKKLDKQRVADPHWYKHESMLGMACYVDLFAGDLNTLHDRIPYLQSLGVTYLHLMPLYAAPDGDSDGGYAVSDYRKVNPELGTTKDLKKLADALSEAGISLVLDFVFNHTSDEHRWAEAAKQGDPEFQQYYYMFDNRDVPNQYEKHLREIFPQVRRGSFSWNEASQKWVWTTFNNFQWDLNYSNPSVFTSITEEMLFLANLGCEGLRLDALAFIWKEMGTDCENQPKAHTLIKAFNACLQIAAPAVVFKSEAIVHPDEVVKYIDKDECQLSYNPLLMALLWNSLATRKTRLLTASMQKSFSVSPDCAWVNYIRCHDDIGWTFDDEVSWQLGINPHDHRQFLNKFYTAQFPGSFSAGVAFAENPTTGDCRVCGSLASLAGLEEALAINDEQLISLAIKRILLMHGIIFSIGGIPLLYSGDEVGLLNDYEYRNDSTKRHDDRWVQRIPLSEQDIAQSKKPGTAQQRIASGLQKMIEIRKRQPVFGDASTRILQSDSQHVFTYVRTRSAQPNLLVVCNFSEHPQSVDAGLLEQAGHGSLTDLISDTQIPRKEGRFELTAYQICWLTAKPV